MTPQFTGKERDAGGWPILRVFCEGWEASLFASGTQKSRGVAAKWMYGEEANNGKEPNTQPRELLSQVVG